MNRASRPSIARLPPTRLPIRLPTVEKRLSEISEPFVPIDEVFEAFCPSACARYCEYGVCHLVGGLRAGRNRAILAGGDVTCAIAKGEDPVIVNGLERVAAPRNWLRPLVSSPRA